MDPLRDTEDLTEYDVPKLLRTIEALTALNERYERLLAERAASPTSWLTIKQAAFRAGITYQAMHMWVQRRWVESRREGSLIFVDEASLGARLVRMGRRS
jgi:hypothetical protein